MAKLVVVNVAARAEYAWRRINDKPDSVTLYRKTVAQTDQTVRIESLENMREATGGAGTSSLRGVVVFGVKDHPTVTDTDIQRGDTFLLNDIKYRVVDLVFVPGEVQARCEAYQ